MGDGSTTFIEVPVISVAVYSYPDLAGQFKPTETISTNSCAVTQGAVWMLVKSLKDAAGGRWFKVIERAILDNLLNERQIIRETRGRMEQETGKTQGALPPSLFAGVILEGGIIGYDSNTITGGMGARYLGIGGDVQDRQDTVTVYLNAISSQTGEILKSVMTRKTVASYGVRGSIFKFVAFQKLLEGETGYTVNEPGQIALTQAIKHAVRALIIKGALENLWQFEGELAGRSETQLYLADKEDDLLLGASADGSAQALLTNEQLTALAMARKKRRQRLAANAQDKQQRVTKISSLALPAAVSLKIGDLQLTALYQVLNEFRSETARQRLSRKASTPVEQQMKLDTSAQIASQTGQRGCPMRPAFNLCSCDDCKVFSTWRASPSKYGQLRQSIGSPRPQLSIASKRGPV